MMNKILIIEDEKNIRESLQDILEIHDYEVMAAENGMKGIEIAEAFRPDLVICDVMMPEMDGYETIRRLRASEKLSDIPFIFLTAKVEKDDFREGMNLGADDYLTKPFESAELLKAIRTRLEKWSREREKFTGIVEEFTEKLSLMKDRMEEVAWANSHILRAPVARIVGLLQLMLKDIDAQESQNKELFQMLKATSKELDEAIIEMNKMINKL